jgi:N-methylhydantoinase A/oxoprolinase/acetone carboxylase beta subunit
MRIGLGIDTGGTCTDAVLFDFDSRKVLASAKAVTTKEDLTIGILMAIDSLPAELLPGIVRVALSTTLATNACVENKGGRAKLLMMNAYRKVVADTGHRYGLPPLEEIAFLNGEQHTEDEWEAFFRHHAEWARDAESLGVVELDAGLNGAVLEKDARQRLQERFKLPVIGSHELFAEPNVLQRGAGTLLNARLMPVIGGFLEAVRRALSVRGIEAPVVIVRSDGTLMSESFTGVRPVETLLCGPAASVMGGMALSGSPDSLIVDMGGTTTDMAVVRGGVPLKARDGVRIGKWKTYVKGVYIDTFGLGGDSEVRQTQHGALHLDSSRVMPLCMAASRWPDVVGRLKQLLREKQRHTLPLQTFFALQKDPGTRSAFAERYTEREQALCEALANGPLIWTDAAAAIGVDPYNLDMRRLEREGVVIRCGLTPTDLMHVRGEFTQYNREASELGLRFVAASCDLSPEELTTEVYNRIQKTIYVHLVRLLLEEADPWYRRHGLGHGLERLIEARWEAFRKTQGSPMETTGEGTSESSTASEEANPLLDWQKAGAPEKDSESVAVEGLLQLGIHTPAVLVGIGAPTHLFLPLVAAALGTTCVLPDHAGVANALGAIISHVAAEATVEVRLEGGPGGIAGFRVRGFTSSPLVETREEALAFARAEAEQEARLEARRRGAEGELTVTVDATTDVARAKGGVPIELGMSVTATAVGSMGL